MERMSRREFMRVSAIAAGGCVLGACGVHENQTLPTLEQFPLQQQDNTFRIDRPATGEFKQAERLNPPKPQPPLKTWQNGAFITKVLLPPGNRSFAFTIDDGPSPYNSELILRESERLGIFVTPFLIGVNVIAWPDIPRRFRDAGHELGAHSMYHTPYSAVPLAEQMQPTKDLIYRETGVVVVANRTPGLTRGGNSIILHTARNLGMYEVHTSLTQSDYKSPRWSSRDVADELASQIFPGGISLNHDGGNLRPTGTGWGEIVNVAVSRGYNCARLTDMINSGIPYPGGVSYSNPGALESNIEEFDFKDYCNYSPEKELKRRLEDVDVKYAEKMRITEALLQLEETAKVE